MSGSFRFPAHGHCRGVPLPIVEGRSPAYAATKTVSFYTSHCSQFAVVPDEEGGSGSGGISIALIAGIAVAIAAAAGIAVYFLFLRKKTA
jgi:hypothetical protein